MTFSNNLLQGERVDYWELVTFAAAYRYQKHWSGARELMTQRGFDPQNTILTRWDQAEDKRQAYFILPDGTVVCCNFEVLRLSGKAFGITEWSVLNYDPDRIESLGIKIVGDPRLRDALDRAALAYYDFHLRPTDEP